MLKKAVMITLKYTCLIHFPHCKKTYQGNVH